MIRFNPFPVRLLLGSTALIIPMLLSCRPEPAGATTELDSARHEYAALRQDHSLVEVHFPQPDPGGPLYARVGPLLNQFLVAGDTLVIPFYRHPECVPPDFNLLEYFHPPFAFACRSTVQGTFLIEALEPAEMFPARVHSTGSAVPFWFVSWSAFQAAMAGGVVTLGDLERLEPIRATAHRFEEYLRPRERDHQVVIEAQGTTDEDNRGFHFSLHHRGDAIIHIELHLE